MAKPVHNQGFTIAEILIAAAILGFGLLASLSVFSTSIRVGGRMHQDLVGPSAARALMQQLEAEYSESTADFAGDFGTTPGSAEKFPDTDHPRIGDCNLRVYRSDALESIGARNLYEVKIECYVKGHWPDDDDFSERLHHIGTYAGRGYFY